MYVICHCNVEWKALLKHSIHVAHQYSDTTLNVSISPLCHLDATYITSAT